MIFEGMPGCDQGSTSLAWMMPPLPQLVSIAAALWRSIKTTSLPAFFRYHAAATPTTPAPRITVVMPAPSFFVIVTPGPRPRMRTLASRTRGSRANLAPDARIKSGHDDSSFLDIRLLASALSLGGRCFVAVAVL